MDDIKLKKNYFSDERENSTSLTLIQQFYKDTVIFITGSTGFLGQILLEKLLRSCPEISTIYILVRNKKGKNVHTRVEEMFDNTLFDRLKRECPKFRHKVVGVVGDCSLPEFGLSLQDKKILTDEVNVIFHVAATVRFDEKLKTAVAINIRATQDILTMAYNMPKLKSVMHVSTAYANCIEKTIEERIYPPPISYKKIILLAETLPDKMLDNISPKLLDKYPNTYAFTKQIAEDVIQDLGHGLPIGVFRPAIVVSTYREPIRAWINNMYGPTGVSAGAGVGLLRTLHCDSYCNANIVPADMVVNSLIAAAWEVGTSAKNKEERSRIPVYNYESSNDQPINWKTFMENTWNYGKVTPSVKAVWYYSFRLQKSYFLYYLTTFLLHIIPAIIVDVALVCTGKSPKMVKVYSKIHKFSAVISYFSTKTFIFKSENVQKLCKKMSPKDKEIFFSDLKQLDWSLFFQYYIRGIRIYLVQDPMDTLPEARTKWNRLYWAHQITKTVLAFILLRIIWTLLSLLYKYYS